MRPPFVPPPRLPGRPIVFGHRGASAEAPENTLPAFALAMARGADGVELDAWRCATGEVVVAHDEDLRRTGGSPLRVAESSLAALREVDVGGWKGPAFRGTRVPLLAEVFDALPDALVNVELKGVRGRRDPGLAAAVAAVLRDRRAEGRTIVSSFDFGLVADFRAAAPRVPTALLFEPGHAWPLRVPLAALWLRPSALNPELGLATPRRVARWTAGGRGVFVYTVDEPAEIDRLCASGATGFFANDPARAREAVRRATGR
jgi:glycerophosphoryl diester phosphodiesterase